MSGIMNDPCLYIGSTKDAKARISYGHFNALDGGYHGNHLLSTAWRQHSGEAGFSIVILERVDDVDRLQDREQSWLDHYSSTHSFDALYNLSTLAERVLLDEESERRLNALRSQRWSGDGNPFWGVCRSGELNPFYGRHHTEETKKAIGDQNRAIIVAKGAPGHPHTEETKQLLRRQHLGMRHGAAAKAKLSRFFKGRRSPKECIPMKQLTKDGDLITIWSSALEAWENTKIDRSSIGRCAGKKLLKGRRSLTAGGFRWEFATLDEFAAYHGKTHTEYCDEQTKIRQSKDPS